MRLEIISMTFEKLRVGVIAVGLVTALPAQASNPGGLVAVVTKVQYEPSEAAPERVIVRGAFATRKVHEGKTVRLSTLGEGYMYFTCPEGKAEVCKREWADLAKAATTQGCVIFGEASYAAPRVRKAVDKPTAPEAYPIQMGVVAMDQSALCDPLRKLLPPR